MRKICLIVPCYNEESRLKIAEFNQEKDIVFVFVNDGSKDHTLQKLQENFTDKSQYYIVNLEKNGGKAEAVRQGMLFAVNHIELSKMEWIGFWDADLAIPLYEVKNFMTYQNLFYPSYDAVFGSRIPRLGSNIKKRFSRYILGKMFITLIRVFFGINVYDSQCGAKIFRPAIVNNIFLEPFISSWLFDVEFMLRMKNLQITKITEYPLIESSEIFDDSKINIFRDMPKVSWEIIKIWKKYCLKKK